MVVPGTCLGLKGSPIDGLRPATTLDHTSGAPENKTDLSQTSIMNTILLPYARLHHVFFHYDLNLKAPNKNCSRRHFNFWLLSFQENKAWFFMWILCRAEDSLETSSLIFSEKQWKNICECCLLQLWLALSGLTQPTKSESVLYYGSRALGLFGRGALFIAEL